uniref:Hydrolase_4 domain-containing protein n=1 Tax=Rhabditophanes sp. KR3021 TaxID=114890 RepID=A0AC35UIE3_9BILA
MFGKTNKIKKMRPPFTLTPGDTHENIFEVNITLKQKSGKEFCVKSVYQDTMPQGSDMGTCICIHGCPGSLADFKYLTPLLTENGIRTISLNFPGFGLSSCKFKKLANNNEERVQFVDKMIEVLKLEKNLMFIGHSRGSECALKMGALHTKKTKAIILINPVGIKIHKGMKPTFFIWLGSFCLRLGGSLARWFIGPIIRVLYKSIGIKIDSNEVAANCLVTINNTDCAGQAKFVDQINETDILVLNAVSGRDHLIELPVSKHFGKCFKNNIELKLDNSANEEEDMSNLVNLKTEEGYQRFTTIFPEDGHYLQKYKAKFISNFIYSVLNSDKKQ